MAEDLFTDEDVDHEGSDFRSLQEDLQEFLNALEEDPEVAAEIEKLIEESLGADLSEVQTKIMLILDQYLKSMEKRQGRKIHTLRAKKEELTNKISALSMYFIMRSDQFTKRRFDLQQKSEKHFNSLTKEAQKAFKQTLKRFVIYELYKVLNPKRIAGETKAENFINNVITSGMKQARKFEGGKDNEIKQHSPELLKQLEKEHKEFKKAQKSQGRGR